MDKRYLQDRAMREYHQELRLASERASSVESHGKSVRKVLKNAPSNLKHADHATTSARPRDTNHSHVSSETVTFEDEIDLEDSEEYDTDLESDKSNTRPNKTRRSPKKVATAKKPASSLVETLAVVEYKQQCQQLNVVPNRQVLTQATKSYWRLIKSCISVREMQPLCKLIISSPLLVSLDFTASTIGPAGLRFLLAAMHENHSIEELILSENSLGSEGCAMISANLKTLYRIRVLNLSANQFKQTDGPMLAQLIAKLLDLRELDLSKNELGEQGAEAIAEALCENVTLQTLDLSWNQIRLGGARALGRSLHENQSLSSLNLSWNGFCDETLSPLARSLESNQGLLNLDLSNNRIGLDGAVALSRALELNQTLQTLKINQNFLTTYGAEHILAAIKKNQSSHLKLVEMQNVLVTFAFCAAYSQLLETRKVVFLHDKYVRLPKKVGAEGPNAKDVLKVLPNELLCAFLIKHHVDISKQEITFARRSVELDGESEDDSNVTHETIKVHIVGDPDTRASLMNVQHFKTLLNKLVAPLDEVQVDYLIKKYSREGFMDVTQFLLQNLKPDYEEELIPTPEESGPYSTKHRASLGN